MAKAKKSKKTKRIMLITIFCLCVNSYILYSVGSVFKDVYLKKLEKKELSAQLIVLQDEEKKLQAEASKLQDPSYIAKYAREKFLYSGKNEYIIKVR